MSGGSLQFQVSCHSKPLLSIAYLWPVPGISSRHGPVYR
jgi:hypothetical protein